MQLFIINFISLLQVLTPEWQNFYALNILKDFKGVIYSVPLVILVANCRVPHPSSL